MSGPDAACRIAWGLERVRFSVVAVDYDGTIAADGVLHPDVRVALGEVRELGITAILVTGRILGDLQRVAGDLRFVDAVVAENGAVLHFPGPRHSRVLGRPPDGDFLAALQSRGIAFEVGDCVVEATASVASSVVTLIREMEVPLTLAFNRSRLMILPEGISKATGLREALAALRRSAHNTVGIGDAENDYALLEFCEVGLAVEWGSPRLKAMADAIIEGSGPSAVADCIRRLAAQSRLSPELTARRRVLLGHSLDNRPVTLAVLGRNLLIAGRAGSGKSWVAGLLAEQLILQRYCVCVIDPEGDYRSLESLPGVLLLGGDGRPPRLGDVADALRHPDVSVVVELAGVPHVEKIEYLHRLLPALADLRRRTGLPHRIVVDEAHYFLDRPDVQTLLDLELAGYALVTYRVSQLRADVLATLETVVFTHEDDAGELRAVCEGFCVHLDAASWGATLNDLGTGEAAIVSRQAEAWEQVARVRLAPRITPHVRHRTKYFDVAVAEGRSFVFTENGRATGYAGSLRAFVQALTRASAESIQGHVRRGDFSRWVGSVFNDDVLASSIKEAEAQHRSAQITDVTEQIARAIRARYDQRAGEDADDAVDLAGATDAAM